MLTGIMQAHLRAVATGDLYWTNVVFLDGFNGANASTATADESPAAHGAGTVANCQLSTTQIKFGSASLMMSGSIGGVTWPASADWSFGALGAFTVEGWAYPNTITGTGKYAIAARFDGTGTFSWMLYINTNQGVAFAWSPNGSTLNIISNTTPTALTAAVWHHIAFDYDGTKARLYVDGTCVSTSTVALTVFNAGLVLSIGNDVHLASNYPMNGFIDEVRITKGVARYHSDTTYTVPTAAFPRHG